MIVHTLRTECWLPSQRDQVFPFFADAFNLELITPPWLSFRILTPPPIVMGRGARIDYLLQLHGIPFRWQTEITEWDPPHRFVDEQRRGPYRLWVHTHTFREQGNGTLCRDQVDYAVPGGRLVERLFVRRRVRKIFAYREHALKQCFPPAGCHAADVNRPERRGRAEPCSTGGTPASSLLRPTAEGAPSCRGPRRLDLARDGGG